MRRPLILAITTGLLLTSCTTGLSLRTLDPVDVQRGREIAVASGDVQAVACADAILAAVPADVPVPRPVGVFSAAIAAREQRRAAESSGVPDAVTNACAPLERDAVSTLAKLAAKLFPGAGALGGLLGR